MAVVDHDKIQPSIHELDGLMGTGADVGEQPTTAWSRPALVTLAVLCAAAGAIHLAMAPSHATEWLPHGIAFAAAGWCQIGLAIALVAWPSRTVIRLTCLANLVFAGAWLMTRVWGWPIGPDAGAAEAATFVDLTCVAFEVLAVLGAAALLARPGLGARMGRQARTILSVVPLAIVVLATAAIASPSATEHTHGGADETADGHVHGDAAPEDDKGLSLVMNGAGEGGGHVHDTTVVELDDATQAQLDAQLAAMQPFIDQYPTVADAEAGGYHRQGPYAPGLGAHYAESSAPSVSLGPTMTDEALKHPMLIYDGITPDSKLAGFMYMIYSTDTQNPPEGFIGPNDHWHYHTNVCLVVNPDGSLDAPLGADASATQELCDRYGGILVDNTGYMVHVWPVPGYESPQGLFSNVNAKLSCPDGTYYTVAPEEIGNRTNTCRDVSS